MPLAVSVCLLAVSAVFAVVRRKKEYLLLCALAASLSVYLLFMLTYIPISLAALVGKVEWKPIRHGIAKAQEEKERA